MANNLDLKRYYFGKYYSVSYGNPDIKVYLDRLARGADVSDFTDPILPHYLPLYFLNQLADHVHQQKYIKIGSDPIFNDDHATQANNDAISSLLEHNDPPTDEVFPYSGEKTVHSKLTNDDISEISRKSRQQDVFPPPPPTDEAMTPNDGEIFRRDDENRKGPT